MSPYQTRLPDRIAPDAARLPRPGLAGVLATAALLLGVAWGCSGSPDAACSPTNCNGCCRDSVCVAGTALDACGTSGNACDVCVQDQVCSGRCSAGGAGGAGGGLGAGGGAGGGGSATGGGGGTTIYCASCTASSQCGDLKNFCLGSGATGNCGTDCSGGQTCPSAAACVQIVNSSNVVVGSNCVPTSGVCGGGTGGGGGTGAGGGGASCTDTWANYAKAWFSSYCSNCHGSLEFGSVSSVSSNKANIRSRISSGNMPPGGGVSAADRTRITSWIDCGLKP